MNQKNKQSLRKLSELRSLLEGFAARSAASNTSGNSNLVKDLKILLTRLSTSVRANDYTGFRDADFHLHESIIQLADVPYLHEAWLAVWKGLSDFHHRTFDDCFPDARFLIEEHEYLVETILLGDPIAAEDAAQNHIEAVWLRLSEKEGLATNGTGRDFDPLQSACAHVAFQLNRPLRLEEVARNVSFVSPGHLSRLFRQQYGESFQTYLQNMRLDKAAELLRETKLPVTRIAQRVGYRDLSRFGQHFRRKFYTTPSNWRIEKS